jgi:hypothetical protein
MTYFRSAVPGLALSLALMAATPAMAQLSSGGIGSGLGGAGGAQAPAPLTRTPEIVPPALPGAGGIAPVATGPVLKAANGDPTTNLFNAISKGDDGAAQTALGQGADLNAQNQFGETPLDLAIALNRTSITFLLLQTRNELASQASSEPVGAPWLLNSNGNTPTPQPQTTRAIPVSTPPRAPAPVNNGTPNPQAGFLGFGNK